MSDNKQNISAEQGAGYMSAFLTMVFLFFIVGFLTTVNTQFQAPLKVAFLGEVGSMQNTFATLITFSWFLAYPVCGGLGSRWINVGGYRSTLIKGLSMMATGLLLFLLSAKSITLFPGVAISVGGITLPLGFVVFLIGSFVTGGSVTVLQVVINPYLTACFVKGTQPVQRMAIGGSANSIGTAIAPYFVTGVVFSGMALEEIAIDSLVMPFLVLVGCIVAIALALRFISLPDLSATRSEPSQSLQRSVWSFRHMTLGVVAIFFYVGAEVCIGANITMYAIELTLPDVALLATIYWSGILVGRLIGSSLSTISPRVQLIATTSAATLLTIGAIVSHNAWLLAAVGLCHSIMWGCIFTLAVKGLGRYTTVASGAFMTGVVGGAILPLIQGAWADFDGSWTVTWWLVVACELFMLYYAVAGSKIRAADSVE